jgi:parallel beta-helix repeat protein
MMEETMKNLAVAALLICVLDLSGCVSPPTRSGWSRPPGGTLDLQELLDGAMDGSTVTIPFGEYVLSKGLVVQGRKNLVLTSRPGTRILVTDTNADVLSILESSGIRVANLYLRHCDPLEEYRCHGVVIRVRDSNDTVVQNCELKGCGAVGVSGWNSKNILVRNCLVQHNTFNAFYFQSCGDVKIQSTVAEDNGNFIQMYDT